MFGPVEGVLFAALGSNLAAGVSYLMGRYLGKNPGSASTPGAMERYAGWMKRNAFQSVLLMRLAYAPFDPVGLLAGFLRLDWPRFALATALGSLPCTLSLVLLGASLQTGPTIAAFGIDPRALLTSTVLLAGSLLVSRISKRTSVRRKGTR